MRSSLFLYPVSPSVFLLSALLNLQSVTLHNDFPCQLIEAHIDQDVLEAAAAAAAAGARAPGGAAAEAGPRLTVTCNDCGRRYKDGVLGRAAVSVARLLRGGRRDGAWRAEEMGLAGDADGRPLVGEDGRATALRIAFRVGDWCELQVPSETPCACAAP